jgi:TatA/E family protein of Tat protein translocase
MYGFGHLWELVVLLLIALIFFGPKRLPELGSGLGKGIRSFRKRPPSTICARTSRRA